MRRSRWNAERLKGGLEPSALRGGRRWVRQGRSPGARPGPGSGLATPESLNNTVYSRAGGAGLSRSPRSGVGLADAKEGEAGDVTWTTRFSGQRKREAHIKPEPQGRAGKGANLTQTPQSAAHACAVTVHSAALSAVTVRAGLTGALTLAAGKSQVSPVPGHYDRTMTWPPDRATVTGPGRGHRTVPVAIVPAGHYTVCYH